MNLTNNGSNIYVLTRHGRGDVRDNVVNNNFNIDPGKRLCKGGKGKKSSNGNTVAGNISDYLRKKG